MGVLFQDMRTLRFAFAHNQESHGRRAMYDRLQVRAHVDVLGVAYSGCGLFTDCSVSGFIWEGMITRDLYA